MLTKEKSQWFINEFAKYRGCLSHLAFDPKNSKGRRHDDEDEDLVYYSIMDPFAVDIQKLILTKAMRRATGKTQVLRLKGNCHVRTRHTHTMEVVDLSIKTALILGLNSHLCASIAYGHDLGHTSYGHLGEQFLQRITGKNFRHNIFGSIVCQYIERKGKGLNLTYETLRGMVLHSRGDGEIVLSKNASQEDNLVMIQDKIGYTFADPNDVIRSGRWKESDFPKELKELGGDQRERVLTCMVAMVKESAEAGYVVFQNSEVAQKFRVLRKFMYENIYSDIDLVWLEMALNRAFEYVSKNELFKGVDPVIALALMTDNEVDIFGQQIYFNPNDSSLLRNTGILEIVKYLRDREIPWEHPDLDWAINKK